MAQFEKGNRDIIQFISSLITLVAGIVLVFLGFFAVPIGVIDYSVITSFGLFLSFVGAVWHIDIKYDFKTKEIERDLKKDKKADQFTSFVFLQKLKPRAFAAVGFLFNT